MKLLVESFTCGERRRRQILSNLKISENKWQIHALRYKDIFIDSVKSFKTLEFAVDALKKQEFSILKSCLKGWVMGSLQKMSCKCIHFSGSQEMYRFVSTLLSTVALGAFRKCTVVCRTHLVRETEIKQEVSITI